MAFTSTKQYSTVAGDRTWVVGTFANTAGSTGGEIETGLKDVDSIQLSHAGSAVVASAPVANETFPIQGGDVTIVTVADTSGTFLAIGRE